MFGRANWGNTSQTIRNQLIGRPASNAFGGGFTNQLPRQQPPPGNGVAMGGGAFQGGGAMGAPMPPQQMAFMGNRAQQEFGMAPGNPGNQGVAGGVDGAFVGGPMQSGMNRPMQNSPMAPMPNGPMGGGQFSPMAPAGQPPVQRPMPAQYSPMAPAQRPPTGLSGFNPRGF